MSENLKKPEDWYMYYVASPYTHPDPAVKTQRYDFAVKAAKAFTRLGYSAFVPIAYDGLWDLDPNYTMDHSWSFWERIDLPILDKCSALILFEIPDWEKSTGVKAELQHCHDHGIPVMSFSLADLDNEEVIRRKMTILIGMIKRNSRIVPPRFISNVTTPCRVKTCGCEIGQCKNSNTASARESF